jgi:chromosome segregation ATPase
VSPAADSAWLTHGLTVDVPNSRAKIILTLLNGGPDAHRPDVYGDEITIERTIMREGASTWKIRGKKHGQKEISKKREELTNICQAMSIQIDNPLTVLTQDQSRNFLASSDPAKKYDVSVSLRGGHHRDNAFRLTHRFFHR